jgi:homoserine kinase
MESIRVYAPATVANVACGFDIFGFAVNRPGDEVLESLLTKLRAMMAVCLKM